MSVSSLHMQAAACRHPSGNIATTTWCCPLQATAVLALGNMHPACHALVLAESAVLAEDYPDRQMQRVSERVARQALFFQCTSHQTQSITMPAHSNPSCRVLASQPTHFLPCLAGHCHAIHAWHGAACAAAGRCAAGACARDAHAGQQPSSGQPGRQCGECGEGLQPEESVPIGFHSCWDCLMACVLSGVPCLTTMQMVRSKLSELWLKAIARSLPAETAYARLPCFTCIADGAQQAERVCHRNCSLHHLHRRCVTRAAAAALLPLLRGAAVRAAAGAGSAGSLPRQGKSGLAWARFCFWGRG